MNLKNSKLLANNWVITLTATLIGVFLALYLNEWVASYKLNNQKEIATKMISSEIAANQKRLNTTILEHKQLLDFVEFLSKYVDDEDNLIAPSDSMNKFKNQYPDLVTINDSTLLSDGNYHYKGQTNFDLSLPHLQLTTIAWETLKNSGFSPTYKFECLMYLESIDKIITAIFQKDGELLDFLSGIRDSGTKNENFIVHLRLLIKYEEILSSIYNKSEEELKNCG